MGVLRFLSGPVYWPISIVIIVAVIVRCRALLSQDGSERYPLPDLSSFDALTLAFLQGGRRRVLLTALFDLTRESLIEINKDGNNIHLTANETTLNTLHPIKAAICSTIQSGVTVPVLLTSDADLISKIDKLSLPMQEVLFQTHLLRTGDAVKKRRGIRRRGMLIVLGLGLLRLFLDTKYQQPEDFVISIFVIAVSVSLYLYFVRTYGISYLGIRYLHELTAHVKELMRVAGRDNQPSGIDITTLYVVHGCAPFAENLDWYRAYEAAFIVPSGSMGGG